MAALKSMVAGRVYPEFTVSRSIGISVQWEMFYSRMSGAGGENRNKIPEIA